jgi:hypothetical protein
MRLAAADLAFGANDSTPCPGLSRTWRIFGAGDGNAPTADVKTRFAAMTRLKRKRNIGIPFDLAF